MTNGKFSLTNQGKSVNWSREHKITQHAPFCRKGLYFLSFMNEFPIPNENMKSSG